MASKVQEGKGNRRPPRWAALLVGGTLGLAVLLVGLYGFYAVSYQNQIFPRVTAAGIPLGGLAVADAAVRIEQQVSTFAEASIPLTVNGETVEFLVADVAPSYDPDTTAAAAYAVGRSGRFWPNVVTRLQGLLAPISVGLTVSYDEVKLAEFIDGLSTKFDTPEQNAHAVVNEDGVLTIEPEKNGRRFDHGALEGALNEALTTATVLSGLSFPLHTSVATITRAHVERLLPTIEQVVSVPLRLTYEGGAVSVDPEQLADWITIAVGDPNRGSSVVDGFYERVGAPTVQFDRGKIVAYLTTIAEKVNQEPVDAKLAIKDGKATIFQASRDGRTLNEDEGATRVVAALEARRSSTGPIGSKAPTPLTVVELPVTAAKAQVTSATIEQLGIQELIGTATTDFSGSPSNRVHNITTGTKYLNGILVKPGEDFSTVKALGSVDAASGYLPELVIKENRTIPEFGGGLCQVSTTLFRASLNAGLTIAERRNHSYRVSYYERGVGPGLDATVYLPRPDFRFANDTPGWILVQGSVKGTTVTFELYGTKDGRVATIDGPHTLSTTPAPPDVYETSNELAPGEVKQLEKPHEGARTVATYKVTRNGETLSEQTFTSSYKALPARFLKGPDAAPPTETSELAPTETTDSGESVQTNS